MSEQVGQGRQPTTRSLTRMKWLPFWVLQATEIVVALVFVDISIHVANGGILVVAALLLVAAAVTAHGPLGFFRVVGQRLHVQLMMAFSVLLALTPIIPLFRPDIQGIIVIEFGAVGLLRLCTLARTDDLPAVRRSAGGSMIIDGTVIDARATVVDGSAPPPPSGPGPGRAASDAAGSGSPANPTKAGRTSDAAARWVGQASGVVITSGKQVAAAHRPEVEAQVKRGIRSLGKLAGKLTKPTPPDGSAD